jgi:hypothetical protein
LYGYADEENNIRMAVSKYDRASEEYAQDLLEAPITAVLGSVVFVSCTGVG